MSKTKPTLARRLAASLSLAAVVIGAVVFGVAAPAQAATCPPGYVLYTRVVAIPWTWKTIFNPFLLDPGYKTVTGCRPA